MKKNWMKNNNLDEMQEQELLKIEHNGCWLAFWGLLAVMAVQQLIFGVDDPKMIAGEWIVFFVLCLYLAGAYIRRGIWDRRIGMSTKNNLILSAAAALVFGIFSAAVIFRNYHMPAGTAAAAIITAVITFVLCFAALTIAMKQTEKRRKELEEEPADEDRY